MPEIDAEVPGMQAAVERRRRQLNLTPGDFARAANLTQPGLAPVRKGIRRNYSEKTLFGVAEALQWPSDWYDRLLAGEDPSSWSADPVDHGHGADYNARIARISEGAQAAIDAIIEAEERKLQG